MIRIANKFDIPKIIDMLWNYHDHGNIPNLEIENDETAKKILAGIIAGAGIALVDEQNGELTGMLIAICNPYLWDNSKLVMNEIAYWVELDYRHTSIGYRLLKKYIELCEEMKLEGRIHFFTISQMEGQELNYDRFGFRPIEHTWSQ